MPTDLTPEGCPRVLGDGRYVLEGLLGSGGSGLVYRARGPSGPCAVKLRAVPDDPMRAARFLVESVPMSRVRHPRVVRVHDTGRASAGEGREYYWIAMDLCERGTVADRVAREGPLPLDEALELVEQVLEALDAVHTAGFVHRDVKPPNVFLDDDGGAVLGDFGVARHLDGGLWFRTGTGQAIGTMGYRAPEQDLDARTAGPAADVYGVAATLWLLLTGQRPPLLYAATSAPSILDPLPEPVRPLIRDATLRDPDQRIPTAAAMRARVREVRDTARRAAGLPPVEAPPPSSWMARVRGWLGG